MRDFEKLADIDAPKNVAKMEKLAGKDDLRNKQLTRVKNNLKEIKEKYGRHKSDFMLNANLKNAASSKIEE